MTDPLLDYRVEVDKNGVFGGLVNIFFVLTSRTDNISKVYTLGALTLPSKPRFEFSTPSFNISLIEKTKDCNLISVSETSSVHLMSKGNCGVDLLLGLNRGSISFLDGRSTLVQFSSIFSIPFP